MRTGPSLRARTYGGAARGLGLEDVAASVASLRTALGRIFDSAGVRRGARGLASGTAMAAVSQGRLGLDPTLRATTLSSTAEILAEGAIGDQHPVFAGTSTSQPTIGGTWAGGDDVLTFVVKNAGYQPASNLLIDVIDGQGTVIDTLHFKRGEQPGTIKTLAGGLTLSFSIGTLEKGDRFELEVFADGATSPDRTFDTQGQGVPLFDAGQVVTPGSFEVEGVRIDVLASDSIRSVLEKISRSAAGVSARFDVLAEKVVLERDLPGAQGLRLGNDSSGFLAAVKLEGAEPVFGKDSDLTSPLADVTRFAGVRAGSFTIGERTIRVDPLSDSLADILRHISTAPGVEAAYSEASDTVSIAAGGTGDGFTLGNDTSGLLAALRIDEGSYGSETVLGRRRARGQLQVTRHQVFRESLREFGTSLDTLFEGNFDASARGTVAGTLSSLQAAVAEALKEAGHDGKGAELDTGLGLDFRFGGKGQSGLVIDSRRLQRALDRNGEELGRLLFGSADRPDEKGLALRLDEALERAGDSLAKRLAPGSGVGRLLDLRG